MKAELLWLTILFLILTDIKIWNTLRQVNNPLGYELVSQDEIKADRDELMEWKRRAVHYYGKWKYCLNVMH